MKWNGMGRRKLRRGVEWRVQYSTTVHTYIYVLYIPEFS